MWIRVGARHLWSVVTTHQSPTSQSYYHRVVLRSSWRGLCFTGEALQSGGMLAGRHVGGSGRTRMEVVSEQVIIRGLEICLNYAQAEAGSHTSVVMESGDVYEVEIIPKRRLGHTTGDNGIWRCVRGSEYAQVEAEVYK